MQQYKVFHQELGAPPPPPQPGYGGVPPSPPPPGAAPTGSASQRAIWALILGIASWVLGCSFLTGIPAWIMGKKEVREIDEGRSSSQGRTLANIGMWLGLINTVLSILALLVIFVVFVIIGVGSMSS